ncbi:MAG: tetratricopeptide repeat protein [Pseudomonadota bacterium]
MNRRERRRAQRAAKQGAATGIAVALPEIQQRFQRALTLFQNGDGTVEWVLREIENDAPGIPEVSHLLGVVLMQMGRAEDAVTPLAYAVKTVRDDPGLFNLLGTAQHRSGDFEAAIASFRKALSMDRDSVDLHYNYGNVLRDAGRNSEAAQHLQEAIRLEPGFADAHYNLALVEAREGRFDAAIEGYRKALELSPDQPDAHVGLSRALIMQFHYEDAEAAAREALALDPDLMQAQSNLAQALQAQGRLPEAEETMRSAIALEPENATLCANLGNILEDADKVAEAEQAYRTAIELDPDFGAAHTNLGILQLLNGSYDDGWREFDWRWKRDDRSPPRPFPQPRWNGQDIAARTVLAWGDEGVGDEILFASLLSDLVDRAGHVIVECDARLTGLFGRAFPTVEVVARTDKPERRLLRPDIDVQTPFTELARWLCPDLAKTPSPDQGYLAADPSLAAECRERYTALGDGPVVGIAWASGNIMRADRNAPLPLWDAILTQPGLQFVSLQYGDRSADLAGVRSRIGVDIFVDPHVDQMKSLEEFAAQVSAVDLVVSITNTTVHMAGALGKPVWTMLPYMPDWRYQRTRPDTPWYPHMRLFRQSTSRQWSDVMQTVAAHLAEYRKDR